VILILENEAAAIPRLPLKQPKFLARLVSHLMLNWDPGNAAERDEKPYPDGYNLLPKDRIGHCHCKDAVKKPDGKSYEWAAMGRGIIDGSGSLRPETRRLSFRRELETTGGGAGTPENRRDRVGQA